MILAICAVSSNMQSGPLRPAMNFVLPDTRLRRIRILFLLHADKFFAPISLCRLAKDSPAYPLPPHQLPYSCFQFVADKKARRQILTTGIVTMRQQCTVRFRNYLLINLAAVEAKSHPASAAIRRIPLGQGSLTPY